MRFCRAWRVAQAFDLAGMTNTSGCPVLRAVCEGREPRTSRNQFSTADPLNGRQPRAKSLFRNILAISPCASRFYLESSRYPLPKSLRINILADRAEKMCANRNLNHRNSEAKSLFRNILAVS